MKLQIKIALIALMGINFGMEAQEWNSNGDNSSKGHLTLDGSYINMVMPETTGGWARGFYNLSKDKSTRLGGVGLFGSKENPLHYFMAHGNSPWQSGLGLYIKTNGNLGIGITDPKSKLQVSGGSNNWNESIQGLITGSIHLDPKNTNDNFGSALTFGASDSSNGQTAQAGIYVRSDGSYGTKMYFATTDRYLTGSKTAMSIDNKGNIGIGNINPKSKLQVSGGSNDWNESTQGLITGSIHLDPKNTSDNFGSALTFGASDSSNGQTAQAGIYVRSDGGYGTKMYFATTDRYLTGSKTAMSIDNKGNVGIGTTKPDSELSVNGKIHTKEVKVDLVGWSDFVFYENYKLPTLTEVETHIKENGHLKDIPSAKEVAKNGILLGEMDSKLLQKIEELTLYTIAQEKNLHSQKEEINNLKKENETLKSLNFKLIEIQKRLDKLEGKK